MKINTFSKVIASGVVATLMSMTMVTSVQADSKRLTSPIPDWTGGAVTCKIAQILLEQELGYKVKAISMPSGPGVYEAIAAGDLD